MNNKPLALYASDPNLSRGRLYATSPSPTRSEFQRDRDRIIHSTAFRRLQYKTQVFLHHEGLHYRTRLTHTLEVSQIARSMARALHLNEDLAEAIALAHDLGHTPFGHAGERALNKSMTPWGGFDHNIQALRTVCVLENRYAGHDGVNLTWETLEGILKHNGPVNTGPDLRFMPDQFDLELNSYASLEAQVAAIADDIAYDAHDIDDAVRAGVIKPDQLATLPLVGDILDEVRRQWPNIEASRQTHEVQRRLITRLIEDAIGTGQKNIVKHAPDSVQAVRAAGRVLISFSPDFEKAEKALKSFLFTQVYRAPEVMKPVLVSEKVVSALFKRYFESGDLPGDWKLKLSQTGNDQVRARTIADFIAGMTDPYALDEHLRLFDDRPDLG